MSEKKKESRVTIIKSDPTTGFGVSEVSDYYDKSKLDEMLKLGLVAPDYNPASLYDIVESSTALQPCIDAYEMGISGTGFKVTRRITEDMEETQGINITSEQSKTMDVEKDKLNSLLSSPYPELSFTDIRTAVRRDAEITGTGYIEVIHNLSGQPIMFRNQPSSNMLASRLSKPIDVEVLMVRGTSVEKITMKRRIRKYCLKVNGKKRWYKDQLCPYHIDAKTGSLYKSLPPKDRGDVIIPYKINTRTPYDTYGRPRWLAATPGILGIRAKDELNHHFLRSGGIPPALIFISGGAIASETVRTQLEGILSGAAQDKMQAAIVEVDSSGSFDSNMVPKVDIKTFSSKDQEDPMFGGYAKDTRKIVREIYRLTPLMLGGAEEYSHAAAQTALISTEALVFGPLREKEDNFYNRVVFPYMGIHHAKTQSNPLTMRNPELMQKLIDMVLRANGVEIPAANLITEMNRIAGTKFVLAKGSENNIVQGMASVQGQGLDPNNTPKEGNSSGN